MKHMKAKMYQSGDVYEFIEWESPIAYDYTVPGGQREKEADEGWTGKNDSNLKRARFDLRRLIWSNVTRYSKFVTLTYEKAQEDLKEVLEDWRAFTQRLRREGYNVEYVRVLEWQEEREEKYGEKSIHIHAVLFTDRYIPCDFVGCCWGKGFIKINSIKDVRNLGAYVCKYLTKTTLAKYGSHSYMCSKGLLRPKEKRMTSHEELLASLQEVKQAGTKTYTRDFIITVPGQDGKQVEVNRGTYQQYVVKR